MRIASVLAILLIAATAPARAIDPCCRSAGTVVEFSAEASRAAANDLARASAFVEASGPDAAELARRVNATIAAALETAKSHPTVRTRSGTTSTYPVYAKATSRIDAWRMRSEILLESRDVPALARLIGRLQASLGVSQILLLPSPETRRSAEQEATADAIAAFKARAGLIAASMGGTYRIVRVALSGGGRPPAVPVLRSAAAMGNGAPIEPGESTVTVVASGEIELSPK